MTHPIDLSELLAARNGQPTEKQAAKKIATFAVIPAAIVGLFAGTRFVDAADPIERLVWVCAATAFGAGFGVAFLVLGIYYLFGFRPVAILADSLVGSFVGLLGGGTLTLMLLRLKLVHHDRALLPLLLIPLGSVAVPLFRAWPKKSRVRTDARPTVASSTAEPNIERKPPMTRDCEP